MAADLPQYNNFKVKQQLIHTLAELALWEQFVVESVGWHTFVSSARNVIAQKPNLFLLYYKKTLSFNEAFFLKYLLTYKAF